MALDRASWRACRAWLWTRALEDILRLLSPRYDSGLRRRRRVAEHLAGADRAGRGLPGADSGVPRPRRDGNRAVLRSRRDARSGRLAPLARLAGSRRSRRGRRGGAADVGAVGLAEQRAAHAPATVAAITTELDRAQKSDADPNGKAAQLTRAQIAALAPDLDWAAYGRLVGEHGASAWKCRRAYVRAAGN